MTVQNATPIRSAEPGEPLEGADVRRPAVQSVADPAPLGLAAFAMTTLALSLYNTKVWSAAIFPALALALVYGGFVQLLAGMWEFTRKNTFGALAFSSYGAFWISYYVFVHFLLPAIKVGAAPAAAGVFLLGWTIITFYLMIASFRVSGAVLGVFVALTVTFVLLTIGAFDANSSITHAGGWVGVVTAAIAFYASAAGVVNETFKKPLVPVFPLAPRS
ncbi:MAG: acetate uptake transporter [Acidimicrobiales bacterium]